MNQIATTIKLDSAVKNEAQKVAKSMGLSLSTIIENKLREVIKDRRVVFEADIEPNVAFKTVIKKIETDVKSDKNLSSPMANISELEKYLNNI